MRMRSGSQTWLPDGEVQDDIQKRKSRFRAPSLLTIKSEYPGNPRRRKKDQRGHSAAPGGSCGFCSKHEHTAHPPPPYSSPGSCSFSP